MFGEAVRQRIAEAGAADVERVAAADQTVADPPGARILLVENDQDPRAKRHRHEGGGMDVSHPTENRLGRTAWGTAAAALQHAS